MRHVLPFLILLAACDSKPAPTPPPTPPPVKPPDTSTQTPPGPSPFGQVDPKSPIKAGDLEALGFPKDVVLSDFGSNPSAAKFAVNSATHPIRLMFEVHTFPGDAEAEAAYKARRDGRAGADPSLKDEDKYGKKSYFATKEIAYLKGATMGYASASGKEDSNVKPADLEKVIRGIIERLSK